MPSGGKCTRDGSNGMLTHLITRGFESKHFARCTVLVVTLTFVDPIPELFPRDHNLVHGAFNAECGAMLGLVTFGFF